MDYFNDVLDIFMDLDHSSIFAVYGRLSELSKFMKNILICVTKINIGLIGLE